jgi:RND family efflux transporter MFP subunit
MKRAVPFLIASLAVAAPGPSLAASGALVELAVAKQGTLAQQIKAFGTVAADPGGVTTITMPRDATIASVSVRPGQMVHPGDAIATIETAPAAVTQFAQAKSALAFAENDLAHTRALYNEQLATKSTLAASEKAYADAKVAYDQDLRIGADHPTEVLRATNAGVVTAISVSPGDRPAAGADVAAIATRDRLVVNLGLEPDAAPSIAPGARVRLVSPQNGAIDFEGRVASVAAMIDPQSRLVNVVVAIPRPVAARLILGMTLEAHVALAPRRGLMVPRGALLSDEQGTFVYVVSKGVAHRRDVSVALEEGSEALLASGVAPNEQVVSVGGPGVSDGGAVRTN